MYPCRLSGCRVGVFGTMCAWRQDDSSYGIDIENFVDFGLSRATNRGRGERAFLGLGVFFSVQVAVDVVVAARLDILIGRCGSEELAEQSSVDGKWFDFGWEMVGYVGAGGCVLVCENDLLVFDKQEGIIWRPVLSLGRVLT